MASDTAKVGCSGQTVQRTRDSGDMGTPQIMVSLLILTVMSIPGLGLRIKCTAQEFSSTNQERFTLENGSLADVMVWVMKNGQMVRSIPASMSLVRRRGLALSRQVTVLSMQVNG